MATPATTSLEARAKAHLFQPFTSIVDQQTNGPHVIDRAEGIRIYDSAGHEYIDAMAGLWCVNVGYGRQELVDAMAEQAARLSYYHSFMGLSNAPSIELAERLAALAPGNLNKVFFGNSGSDANDTQVKLVWLYNNMRGKPKKKKFIGRIGSYHGVTVASGSLSGLANIHSRFDLPYGDRFVHVGRPHHYWDAQPGETERAFSARLAMELEETIHREGPETIAAFIAEPVMGAGGVILPPEGYFEAIVPILRAHDILFIADEVITGFGRLGRWFGSVVYDIQPDLMTVAKGLTSGYVPMSAVLVSEPIWEVLRDTTPQVGQFNHGFTYSAHPLAAATALANLEVIERDGLVANAATVGEHLQRKLRAAVAHHPLVGEVRGRGCIAGVELVADKANRTPFDLKAGVAKRLYARLLEQGLICRPILNMLAFSPPLIVTESDIDDMVAKFTAGLAVLTDDLRRDSTWTG